jgi:hypothetical protein
MRLARLFLNAFRELSRGTKILDWTCYYGVGDGVGKVASAAGDEAGEGAPTPGDELGKVACGAGNIARPDISNLLFF